MATFLRDCQVRNITAVIILPLVGILLSIETEFTTKTKIWTLIFYFMSGIGITAGYHRLWSHRSYDARLNLQVYLAVAGAACFQGSIRDWSKNHRIHHRYVDTDRDPYSISKGFWHAHIGWLFLKPAVFPDQIEMTDLNDNEVVAWQHRNFATIAIAAGLIFPTLVAGLLWDDWKGGFVYAGVLRIFFFQQSTFCVNSLAHWLGNQPFDDKHSPRDHLITALVTFGEGYHNFHHEFPSDYRNGIKWYQYDPSKWSIWIWNRAKLASRLNKSSQDIIRKGEYQQQLKHLERAYADLDWGLSASQLPSMTWENFQYAVEHECSFIALDGFIYDVKSFINKHPGGKAMLSAFAGKDGSVAFNGGIYSHSNAARNMLGNLRVGILVDDEMR